MPPPTPSIPRYGDRSLADLLPALLPTPHPDPPPKKGGRERARREGSFFEIEAAARVCLLLVDGLGSELLRANREVAPFLNSQA